MGIVTAEKRNRGLFPPIIKKNLKGHTQVGKVARYRALLARVPDLGGGGIRTLDQICTCPICKWKSVKKGMLCSGNVNVEGAVIFGNIL